MSATVRVVNKMPMFTAMNEKAMERALARMRNDIFVLSQFKVPFKDGELKSSGEQKQMGRLHHRVQYGDKGAQEYAAYQHRGRRLDGSRVVKRYTTAGTQKNYLSESGKIIASKASSYFKREAENVRV
jgi:hypothetical protein